MLIRISEPAIPSQNPDFRLLYVGSDQQWLAALRKFLRKPEFHVVSRIGAQPFSAVRKTMEAFALSNYSQNRQYLIIDGYDTARILRHHGVLPRPTPGKRAGPK
jgi:hypothetical protein